MRTYNVCFKLLIAALIIIGVGQILLWFFYPQIDDDGMPISKIMWNPGFRVGPVVYSVCLPFAVYLWKKKPKQTDLLPDVCIVYGIMQIIIQMSYFIDLTMIILYTMDLVLSIGIIVSQMSFKRGDLHCSTRILMLIQVMFAVQLVKFIVISAITGTVMLQMALFAAPETVAIIILSIAIGPLCLYPKDFPGPRLSSQLKDLENTMTNKSEMYIAEKDFLAITGKDMSGWHPSDNPMVESEYEAQILGTKAKKFIKASKWKDEEGIYISLVYRSDSTISWGSGSKIIHVADDTTQSSLKGRVVRLYTDDGFFYSLIVLYFEMEVKNKVKNKLSRFFEDF